MTDASAPSRPAATGAEPRHSPPMEDVASLAGAMLKLPDSVVIVDEDGNIAWGNPSARANIRAVAGRLGRAGPAWTWSTPTTTSWCCARSPPFRTRRSATPSRSGSSPPRGGAWSRSWAPPSSGSGEHVVLLCLRDLTERRRFELATRPRGAIPLAGAQRRLRHHAGVGHRHLESVSGAITRLLGHDPELLERRPLADIVAEADRGTHGRRCSRRRARGASSAHPVTIQGRASSATTASRPCPSS